MSVRISAHDWVPGGVTPDDATIVARLFKAAGADVIDCSSGQVSKEEQPVYGRMFQVPLSDRIRNEAASRPLPSAISSMEITSTPSSPPDAPISARSLARTSPMRRGLCTKRRSRDTPMCGGPLRISSASCNSSAISRAPPNWRLRCERRMRATSGQARTGGATCARHGRRSRHWRRHHPLLLHGARVTMVGRSVVRTRHDGDPRRDRSTLDQVEADVGDPEDVAHAFDEARARSGSIEILVNNAGQAESAPFTTRMSRSGAG